MILPCACRSQVRAELNLLEEPNNERPLPSAWKPCELDSRSGLSSLSPFRFDLFFLSGVEREVSASASWTKDLLALGWTGVAPFFITDGSSSSSLSTTVELIAGCRYDVSRKPLTSTPGSILSLSIASCTSKTKGN
jgi:hypothetical protein